MHLAGTIKDCLAIQVATVSGKDVPTIVFDEIDAGIGGPTAEVVGNLLKKLGHRTQVLCVTHLPQIAAKGETQYLVAKKRNDEKLFTVVEELSAEERIKEIARMLGGVQETKQSLSYAKTLLRRLKHNLLTVVINLHIKIMIKQDISQRLREFALPCFDFFIRELGYLPAFLTNNVIMMVFFR